jgi:type II secretory pathway component PulF
MKFAYTAFDKSGKSIASSIEAATESEAREALRKQELFINDFRAAGASSAPSTIKSIRYGLRLKYLATLSRQLHVLVSSGTPLVQALSAVERQCEDPRWRQVIEALKKRVEEGAQLSEAMRAQPRFFDPVCRSLVAAGETSGQIVKMLDRLAVMTRKQLHLRNSIRGAMVYPIVLVGIGIIVLNLMLLFVLPRFAGLFKTLDTPLPPTTKMLMAMSDCLQRDWWLILIILGASIGGAWAWLNKLGGREKIQSAILIIPKADKMVRSMMSAQVARMLGTLLQSQVPLMDALQLTRESAGNIQYTKLLTEAEEAVSRGQPISAVLAHSDLITPAVQEAIRNAETSGDLGGPLVHMADFLDEENEIIVKALTSLLEPMILIVLGGLVAGMAISMFLPLFDLVSAAHG